MNTNKMRIVCGTDFSLHAAEAANVAAMLATRLGETLVLVHVTENDGLGASSPEIGDSVPASPKEKLHNEAERLRKLGPTVKEELLTGSPYEKLVEVGQRCSTRLVVVSSLGRIAPSRFLVGSVAERTAEHSPVPTLVVRGSKPFEAWTRGERPLKVMAGYDFSSSSDAALGWIRDLRQIGPCDITVAYVDCPAQEIQRLGIRKPSSLLENPPDVQRLLERDLKQRVIPVLGEENVHVQVSASWGRVDEPLIRIASEVHADLVVVGTHQRQGLSRFWLGSVSRAILHHAPQSVMVVPPHGTNTGDAGHIPELKRVLVTTDFSELGNRAIPYAYALLHRGGNVCLLHVAASSAKTTGTAPANKHDPITRQLHCLIPVEAEPRGIQTQLEVVEHQEPAAAICQAAERFGADLICMASHGRSGLSKTILGSVAQDVMTCSKRPLLVVRPPED